MWRLDLGFSVFFFPSEIIQYHQNAPSIYTHKASLPPLFPGRVCVSVIDVCTEPQLLEDAAPTRHLSPPQKHRPRYLDATRNPKAAKAQLQGPWVGWGTRLSVSALEEHHQLVGSYRLARFLGTPDEAGRSRTSLPPAHRSALLPRLP